MEWLERLNQSIAYIEDNLKEDINIEKVAQIACCSTFHFQRMFSYIADVTLSEYIRRRKMSLAAVEIKNTDRRIIDIALDYGYDSPTAFNRAFQSIHGFPPSSAKNQDVVLKAFPPISFKLIIKGDTEMNYRIEKRDEFRIVGVKQHYEGSIEESFAQVPLFWQKTGSEGTIPKMCGLMNKEPFGVLGVSTCMEGKNFDYYIAVASDKEAPEGMADYIVPACTWAIFESIGKMPDAIQQLQKRIVTEWLPTSGYEYANAPDIEVYFEGDQFSDDYKFEVWLPVVPKNK